MTGPSAGVLLTAVDAGVLLLTLNRPAKRNALSLALRTAIVDALRTTRDDDAIGAVVVYGAGGHFCAGFDLAEIAEAADPAAIFHDAGAYHREVHTFDKPLLAAVSGAAIAGGLDLALMCDLRIAGSDARFGQPQVRHGIPASFELVRSVVGDANARDLCITGRQLDAGEALRTGLVSQITDGDPLDATLAIARDIAARPASRAIKRQFLASQPDLFVT